MNRFLFAINTISMVKNDALFSYVAPGNIFAWALMPLRYCMPLKTFVWLNRTVIKITHFPLLFGIYVYERYILAPSMYEPTDLVENPGRGRQRAISSIDPANRAALFSPSIRVREESEVGYQKDRALEEVFLRAPDIATLRTQRRNERRKTQNAIRTWMDQHDGGYASPQNYSTIDSRATGNDWHRRLSMSREQRMSRKFPRQYSDMRSAASDPAEFFSDAAYPIPPGFYNDGVARRDYATEMKENTDADGDDELVTNDEDEEDNVTNNIDESVRGGHNIDQVIEEDYFTTPVATRFSNTEMGSTQRTPMSPRPGASRRAAMHSRTLSTNTILYAPEDTRGQHQLSSSSTSNQHHTSRPQSNRQTVVEGHTTPTTPAGERRSPRRSLYMSPMGPMVSSSRPVPTSSQPVAREKDLARTAPATNSRGSTVALALDIPARAGGNKGPPVVRRRPSSTGLDSSELNALAGEDSDGLGMLPSSFASQMAMATAMLEKSSHADNARLSKLMLAKMKTLEESLGDVVREMRVLRSTVPSTAHNSGDEGGAVGGLQRVASSGRMLHQLARSGPASMGSAPGPAMMEAAAARREKEKENTYLPRERIGLKRTRTTTPASASAWAHHPPAGGGSVKITPGQWRRTSSRKSLKEDEKKAAAGLTPLSVESDEGGGKGGTFGRNHPAISNKGKGKGVLGRRRSQEDDAEGDESGDRRSRRREEMEDDGDDDDGGLSEDQVGGFSRKGSSC